MSLIKYKRKNKPKRQVQKEMKRRNFTAEQKAQIVIELIRGEKEMSQLANEYELAPNQIRNWKSEALENLPLIFDSKRDNKLKERIAELEVEKDEAYKKIGQLTTEVDWLKKKSAKIAGTTR